MPSNPRPRVPRHAVVDLLNQDKTIQVNHCRNPACGNYGARPRTMPGKRGPSRERDPAYKIHSTKKGQVPSLRCVECKENPPIKSNASIAEEITRLIGVDGLRSIEERTACKTDGCPNRGRSVADYPREYRKRSWSRSGGRYYECKSCRHRVLASTAIHLHKRNQSLAVDVLSRIANKSPVRGTVRGARLSSPSAYYRILNFIHRRCLALSGGVDRALFDGRLRLPPEMVIESDAQTYTLNWISRLDRRNVDISAYCSVDSDTRFILGLHSNFDAGADAFKINAESARTGDMETQEPFRKHARYWLAGDELRAGRSKTFGDATSRRGLAAAIQSLYARAASREDVEDIELEHMNTAYRTPFLRDGLLVHMPYLTYAHWFLLRRLLRGAGVERVQMHFDIDSMSRAAFLCAFMDEVKAKRAHAFFVKYDKYFTVDERRSIVGESRLRRQAAQMALPPELRDQVDLVLMKRSLSAGQPYGKWNDNWFEHPNPTMNEPHKAMSWLTPDTGLGEDAVAEKFLRCRLARVDNVFQLTRRFFNAFERPLGTSSGQNTVWHGYQPYNPAMIEKYQTIFRTVANFIRPGDDGRTPAMRLGLAETPLTYEDVLWPGQVAPTPKRSRKRSRAMAV